MIHRCAVAAVALICGLAPAVRGQVVRGTVRDSVSQQPVPGVVLVMLDSAGTSLGRNITDEQGRYTIAITITVQRVRFLRIGFRPRVVAMPHPTSGPAEVNVEMTTIPTLLSAVTIIDQPNCPRRSDRPAALALWEQAKAGLLATVVARDENPPSIVRLRSERRLDDDDRVTYQEVLIDSTATARSFIASRSAAAFIERGFAYDSARARWFNGPDADVMLDDAFAVGYCFRIADADRMRPQEVGLTFSPAKRKRNRIDIDGTLWIDTVSRSLTDVVFRYVGLEPRWDRFRPGGQISFRSMENGSVLIDRWTLRYATPAGPSTRANPPLEPHETGGELAMARWSDGREWHASLGRLRGHVIGNASATSVVELLNTGYHVVVDSAGTFEISNLLPGPYVIGAADSRIADLGVLITTGLGFTAVRDSTVTLTVDVPSVAAYAASMCKADPNTTSVAVLMVRIVLADGSAAAHAHVEVRAVEDGNMRRVVEGEADSRGLFHLCRAPRDTPLQIHVEHDAAAPTTIIQSVTGAFVTLKIPLAPKRR